MKLCTTGPATATDFRSFLELEISLMDIPAPPWQAPCVLNFKTLISSSAAWPWPYSCAASKVSDALLPSKTVSLESVEGMLIRIQFSEFLSPTCSGAICTGNLFLSKSICHPEFLVLRFSDWRSGNVLYIGLDGCALCSPKLHSAFILGVIPSWMQEQAFLLVKKNQQPEYLFHSLLHMYREWG